MTAFKNLAPWEDFVRGRDSDMLRMRLKFTAWLDKLHRKTMQQHSHSKTAEEEQQSHASWQPQARPDRKDCGPLLPCPICGAWK